MVIAVPTGIKRVQPGWIATMWGGSIEFKTPSAVKPPVVSIFLFTVGTVSLAWCWP